MFEEFIDKKCFKGGPDWENSSDYWCEFRNWQGNREIYGKEGRACDHGVPNYVNGKSSSRSDLKATDDKKNLCKIF